MQITDVFSLADIRTIIPELIVVCTGLILILVDLVVRKKNILAVLGVAGTLLALYLSFRLFDANREMTAFGGMFILDGYSNFFKLIFYINLVFTISISLKYMSVEKASFGEYYALLFFATAGMMIMSSSVDLIVLYLGLELMSLTTYILVGIIRHDSRSNEAAIKYFLLGGFASAFLLFGISLTYGLTGTTDILAIADFIHDNSLAGNRMLLLSMILIAVAFGFKIAAAPFHMWAPDAYEGAPTSITAFMSVGPKAAGFAALGRVFVWAFSDLQVEWSAVLIPLALLSMCVGNIAAIAQTNIKRMLAYSSIAHAGYALLGVIAGTGTGILSMMNYLFIYAFMNIGAFSIVIMLRSEGFQGENLSDYEGLAKSHPLASALMLVFMFSLTGIPPTAGFIAKFNVFMEAIQAGYVPLVIFAVIFSVASAFFYLRVVMYMFMKEPQGEVILTTSTPLGFVLAITTLMVIVLGIFPSYLFEFARFSIFG